MYKIDALLYYTLILYIENIQNINKIPMIMIEAIMQLIKLKHSLYKEYLSCYDVLHHSILRLFIMVYTAYSDSVNYYMLWRYNDDNQHSLKWNNRYCPHCHNHYPHFTHLKLSNIILQNNLWVIAISVIVMLMRPTRMIFIKVTMNKIWVVMLNCKVIGMICTIEAEMKKKMK